MKGFKNSTKTQYMKGGDVACYAKGGSVKGAAKISKVMGEFKSGALHSGSKEGPKVTNKKQATAIALSEARKAGAKMPVKKAGGGSAEAGDVLIANMTKEEMEMGAKGIKTAQERMAREKIGNVSDREMRIKEKLSKAVPVARKSPLFGGPITMAEKAMLQKATRPSVEAGDQDPRLLMPKKHGGKVARKADGGRVVPTLPSQASPKAQTAVAKVNEGRMPTLPSQASPKAQAALARSGGGRVVPTLPAQANAKAQAAIAKAEGGRMVPTLPAQANAKAQAAVAKERPTRMQAYAKGGAAKKPVRKADGGGIGDEIVVTAPSAPRVMGPLPGDIGPRDYGLAMAQDDGGRYRMPMLGVAPSARGRRGLAIAPGVGVGRVGEKMPVAPGSAAPGAGYGIRVARPFKKGGPSGKKGC